MAIHPKIEFMPPRAVQGDEVTTVVTWNALPGVAQYKVVLTYPGHFKPQTWGAVVPAPQGGQGPLGVEHCTPVPTKLPDGAYPVRAAVEAGDGGKVRAEVERELQVGGDWKTPGFVYGIKRNLDEKLGGISAALRDASQNGVRLQRATSLAASPLRERFWGSIRASAEGLQFSRYAAFMDAQFCDPAAPLPGTIRMPFSQVDAYLRLKAFTELFLLSNVGVLPDLPGVPQSARNAIEANRVPVPGAPPAIPAAVVPAADVLAQVLATRPYLQTVLGANPTIQGDLDEVCDRLRYPVFIELIWSYWHEEAMLVQALHKLSFRFQNRTQGTGRDPLAQLEIDPLRPLNNVLWGYIQDEQHRLSVRQRAYEYAHHYGLTLEGRAVGRLRPADTRSRFLQAFHNLLYQCVQFYRQADDTTVVGNASPVLFALRDLQFVLAEGAHNQYGSLPWNARLEMLMEQWILSRPEIQDFLRGRRMTPYPEAWMGAVDSMKTLQGWTTTSVVQFRDLAFYGEQLLLSVREGGLPGLGGWSTVADPVEAAAWALAWRPQVEGYIHAYRAATGIDLTIDPTDPQFLTERDLAPSVHLRRRLAEEARR